MNCPRCGKSLAPGAVFCMHCGQVLAPTSAPFSPATMGPPEVAHPVNQSRKVILIAVLLTLAAVLTVLMGLSAAGILKLSGFGARQSVTAVKGQSAQPNVLPKVGQTGPPTLPAESEHRLMPGDVRRWLEHLERIEKRRVLMTETQLASAISSLTMLQVGGTGEEMQALLNGDLSGMDESKKPPTLEKASSDFSTMRGDWKTLTSDFNSVPPPSECVPIWNEYDQVVRETGAMILDILKAVEEAPENREGALQALISMRGKSDARIGKPASESDRLVEQICRKYDTRKWFDIARDIGGKGLMGAGF